ncbi:MAG: VOC family protein [Acidiferrobacterales bacterium]
MKQYGLTFHHFGLAVTQPDRAIKFLQGLGYRTGELVHDPVQNVNLVWCTNPNMPAVEIISPTGSPGPLDNLLKGRNESIYHLCYESKSTEDSLQMMKDSSIRAICVSPPKPAILFENRTVSFYMINGFGLIEILAA